MKGNQDLTVYRAPNDAVELAKFSDDGEYRPLKTAPNLRHGWRLELADLGALQQALDFFYPGRLAALAAWEADRLPRTPLRETLNRQTGMYRVAAKISDQQIDRLVAASVARKEARRDVCGPFFGRAIRRWRGLRCACRWINSSLPATRPAAAKSHPASLPGSLQPPRGRGAKGRQRRVILRARTVVTMEARRSRTARWRSRTNGSRGRAFRRSCAAHGGELPISAKWRSSRD